MSIAAPMQHAKTDAVKSEQHSSQLKNQLAPQSQQTGRSEMQNAFTDLRPQATTQRQIRDAANHSSHSRQIISFQQMAQYSARTTQLQTISTMMHAPALQRVEDEDPLRTKIEGSAVQRKGTVDTEAPKPNNTGLPDNLKSGIESLSGMSMDHVKVHYNSSQPAKLSAHAYAQGNDIHLASGQEQHLPHEAWHVVQQAQGRVNPTRQMKGTVPINDDKALEQEADFMGARALQTKATDTKIVGKSLSSNKNDVAQCLVADNVNTLRIGIMGDAGNLGVNAANLPAKTYVWIMSNKAVSADALDSKPARKGVINSGVVGVTNGQNKSSPDEIIRVNAPKVAVSKFYQEGNSGGPTDRAIYHSAAFEIPRQDPPNNRNEVDYSFLRYAALKSYELWHGVTGVGLNWPLMRAPTTLLETIDSDVGGMTGATRESIPTDVDGKISADWLAEAGMYAWDWSEVKDHERVVNKFNASGNLDTGARDSALSKFSEKYTEAEKIARGGVSSNMFNIYFPEPATRLSSDALRLLANSGFGAMAVTRGQQLGFKRESIGLIAGLVYLDELSSRNFSKSKSKLRFNPSYLVTTGLGKRKDAYVSVFNEWYLAATPSLNDVDFGKLSTVGEFDQSYLKENVAQDVNKWHTASYDAMKLEKAGNVGKTFFHPK